VYNKTIPSETVRVGEKLKIDPIEKKIVQYASPINIDSPQTTSAIGQESGGLDEITELMDAEIG
jgi:hypothetical protein